MRVYQSGNGTQKNSTASITPIGNGTKAGTIDAETDRATRIRGPRLLSFDWELIMVVLLFLLLLLLLLLLCLADLLVVTTGADTGGKPSSESAPDNDVLAIDNVTMERNCNTFDTFNHWYVELQLDC